jgi:hypothetical protein
MRTRINPRAIDWRKNDSYIARKTKRTREGIRQLRLKCYLWSQIDWRKTDEMVSCEIGTLLTRSFGKKRASGPNLSYVRRWRALQDWLYQNQHVLRQSDDFRRRNSDARERIKRMETVGMTISEIAQTVQRNRKWVRRTLTQLGKSYKMIWKNNPAYRWHWDGVKESDWRKLTAKKISALVTDGQGNHPSVSLVVSTRLRFGYRRHGVEGRHQINGCNLRGQNNNEAIA